MKRILKILSIMSVFVLIVTLAAVCSNAYSNDKALQAQTDKCVVLFSKKDYKGEAAEFSAGEYPKLNINSKSIKIPSEYVVWAYSGENFTGDEYFLIEDQNEYFRYDFGIGITFIKGIKSMKISLCESEPINITNIDDAMKDGIMREYAPRIWMAQDDPYGACSMEFVFEKFTRSVDDGTSRISTVEQPHSPFDILETYYGDQENAVCYAFWLEKNGGYIDISYFQFCPFDSGKYIHLIRCMAGGHPGDWEHLTIRFMVYEENGETYMRPVKVAFPAHTFAGYETWESLDKYGENHIEVYCAAGTHGMYARPGNHVYMDLGPIEKLTDVCTKGEAWDVFEEGKLETFEHDYENGSRALAGSKWEGVFGYDDNDPNDEAVKYWGNKTYFPPFLNGGPQGPQYKTEMHNPDAFK